MQKNVFLSRCGFSCFLLVSLSLSLSLRNNKPLSLSLSLWTDEKTRKTNERGRGGKKNAAKRSRLPLLLQRRWSSSSEWRRPASCRCHNSAGQPRRSHQGHAGSSSR